MRKYSFEDKIDIYKKRKNGETLKSLSLQCGMTIHNIQYLVWLVDRHGFDILIPKKNRNYSKKEKERIINRILLNNESNSHISSDFSYSSKPFVTNLGQTKYLVKSFSKLYSSLLISLI